jgi:hypothetical protein
MTLPKEQNMKKGYIIQEWNSEQSSWENITSTSQLLNRQEMQNLISLMNRERCGRRLRAYHLLTVG